MSDSYSTLRLAGRTTAIAMAIFLVPFTRTQADQIYKSVDAQGHVTYSDRPTTAGAKKTDIAVQQADPNEAQRIARENMLLKADDVQRTKKEAADSKAKAQQDSQKKQACESARTHYNHLTSASRLYETNADGTKDYYSDAQADAMRDAAKRAMQAACGS